MSHSGQIQLILGPMFSGKTTELIRRLNRFEMANHKCLVVKYSRDNRYETDATTDCILTHDRNSYMANFKSDNLTDIEPHAAGYSVIGIDEGQFFNGLMEFSEKMANMGKIVIIAALDGTYQRKGFGDVLDLIPLAESVVKLTAVCMKCYKDASFTKRRVAQTQIELIGGSESYQAVCRSCYHAIGNDLEHTKLTSINFNTNINGFSPLANNKENIFHKSPAKIKY